MLENRDCAVRALSNALNKPYYEVHSVFKRLGRKDRRGTKWPVFLKAMIEYGVGIASPVRRQVTHAAFVRTHPKGSFVVVSRSHAWAIKDGVTFDAWRPGPRMVIKRIGFVNELPAK